jgi:hypothetical protein
MWYWAFFSQTHILQLFYLILEHLNLGMVNEAKVTMEVEPTLEVEIREGQLEDAKLKEI